MTTIVGRVLAVLLGVAVTGAWAASVESFSPQGEVKGVRQVTARFSDPMVPFGDPRLVEPFDIDCAGAGSGRWADHRTWVYDFDRDLPAGLRCSFRLREGLTALAGAAVAGDREFAFSTGGPAIRQSLPPEGEGELDEEQVFILGLDAPADPETVARNAWCTAAGIGERIGVTLVTGAERKAILDQRKEFVDRFFRLILIPKDRSGRPLAFAMKDQGSERDKLVRARDAEDSPIVLLRCARRLPNGAEVRLVWGAGIATRGAVATSRDQVLAFRVREAFRARFSCSRVNRDANCIPVLPMSLDFTAPVARELAAKVRLTDSRGREYPAELPPAPAGGGGDLQGVSFKGPFPEKERFHLALPEDLRDDAGRALVNSGRFPVTVLTDEDPPLAKFAANFGIVERNGGAMLPVTLRNVEPVLPGGRLAVDSSRSPQPIPGKVLEVARDAAVEMVGWLRRLRAREHDEWSHDEAAKRPVVARYGGEGSVFAGTEPGLEKISVPRPGGRESFEVVGIPLGKPGFYVVELASPRLGQALMAKPEPYHVRAAALVTNLAVHFKQGRESSLVWVTSLDKGRPVAGAAVSVMDCSGHVHWEGRTDPRGLARIERALPPRQGLPGCLEAWDRQYLVVARKGGDASFALSNWSEGIQPWRFNLPRADYQGPYIATTVFDRTLLRAGETVHMKHYLRAHTGSGFALVPRDRIEDKVVLVHQGSDERFELPVKWNGRNGAESEWTVPREAKQGTWRVFFRDRLESPGNPRGQPQERQAGSFRVEAFRVPVMRAIVKPPAEPLVNATSATVDLQLNYLSGGGAGYAPVKLRGLLQPRVVSFPDHEGYTFGNGGVREGVERDEPYAWTLGEYATDEDERPPPAGKDAPRPLGVQRLTLDGGGAARAEIAGLPRLDRPHEILAEMEYGDPNGEILTAAGRVALWPSRVLVGVKPEGWALSKDKLRFRVMAAGLGGNPAAGVAVRVELLQRVHYSHRKRLIGGFYAYETLTEVKKLEGGCEGTTDSRGLVLCELKSPVAGNVIVQASARDDAGNESRAHAEVWVAGSDDWWFDVRDGDRMDLLPERKRYQPGETARLQVRMPFRSASVLVTVEREGVLEARVEELSGKAPVIEVPMRGRYAPNAFVSALAVRGRVADVQPTALVDLGKPSFRLGYAELQVGWQAHELKVEVAADRSVYRARDQAAVTVKVRRADGKPLPAGAEVAVAAVDEGLLELMPNESWKLLEAMMGRRGIEVETATAQMQVVGKRHFGRKAARQGGGGGRQSARELFETLLFWKARMALDAEGEARLEIPLNDSLTAFRIVAVADADTGLFGTGHATIRSTRDFMLLSGLPSLVRERDRYRATFTARNASDRAASLEVRAVLARRTGGARPQPVEAGLAPVTVSLAPGEAKDVGWEVSAPVGADRLDWEVTLAREGAAAPEDTLKVGQQVVPAVPVRTFQATLVQLGKPLAVPVAIPADAVPGRGGVSVQLKDRLAGPLPGVREFMSFYPYTCLEQNLSKAVALRDEGQWKALMASLPVYLDRDGLARYFPFPGEGSDVLTSYILAVAHEAGWEIPPASKERMVNGLLGFVQGRVIRTSDLPTADATIRKVAALDAIARQGGSVVPALLEPLAIEPNLWPTSAVLDWHSLLARVPAIPERNRRRAEAGQIVRSRLNFQGTTMGFSTERSDFLWWLMVSGDVNANRAVLAMVGEPEWAEDMPRLVRGALGRQQRGHWNTTVANAWGVLAMEKFSARFERDPVGGATVATLASAKRSLDWAAKPEGGSLAFDWPKGKGELTVAHEGSGRPWATLQSRAAIPLKQPFSSGYRIVRTVTPVEQRTPGVWSRGDVLRVRLDLEAQSDMTWVVVNDPVPAGASILGTGLGRDSRILAAEEEKRGWVWPAFEERRADSFRAYYRFVPKGSWSFEYTLRLNNPGRFELPETRAEALYAPEMFGEIPNAPVEVRP